MSAFIYMSLIPNIFTSDFQYGNIPPNATVSIKNKDYIGFVKYGNLLNNMFELLVNNKQFIKASSSSVHASYHHRGMFLIFFMKFLIRIQYSYSLERAKKYEHILSTSKVELMYKYYGFDKLINVIELNEFKNNFDTQTDYIDHKFKRGKLSVTCEYINIYKDIIFFCKRFLVNIDKSYIIKSLFPHALLPHALDYRNFIYYYHLFLSISYLESVETDKYDEFLYLTRHTLIILYIIFSSIKNSKDLSADYKQHITTTLNLTVNIFELFYVFSPAQMAQLEEIAQSKGKIVTKLNKLKHEYFDKDICNIFAELTAKFNTQFLCICCLDIFKYTDDLLVLIPPFNLSIKSRDAPDAHFGTVEYRTRLIHTNFTSVFLSPILYRIYTMPMQDYIFMLKEEKREDFEKIQRFITFGNKLGKLSTNLNHIEKYDNFVKIHVALYIYFIFQNTLAHINMTVASYFDYICEKYTDFSDVFNSVLLDRATCVEMYTHSVRLRAIIIDTANFFLSVMYNYASLYEYFDFSREQDIDMSFLDKYWYIEELMHAFMENDIPAGNSQSVTNFYNNPHAFVVYFYFPIVHNYLSYEFSKHASDFYNVDHNRNLLYYLLIFTKKMYDDDIYIIAKILLLEKLLYVDDDEIKHNHLFSKEMRKQMYQRLRSQLLEQEHVMDTLSNRLADISQQLTVLENAILKEGQTPNNIARKNSVNSAGAILNQLHITSNQKNQPEPPMGHAGQETGQTGSSVLSSSNRNIHSQNIMAQKDKLEEQYFLAEKGIAEARSFLNAVQGKLEKLSVKMALYNQIEKVYKDKVAELEKDKKMYELQAPKLKELEENLSLYKYKLVQLEQDPNFLLDEVTNLVKDIINSLFHNNTEHAKYLAKNINSGIDYVMCMSYFFNQGVQQNNSVEGIRIDERLYYSFVVSRYNMFGNIFHFPIIEPVDQAAKQKKAQPVKSPEPSKARRKQTRKVEQYAKSHQEDAGEDAADTNDFYEASEENFMQILGKSREEYSGLQPHVSAPMKSHSSREGVARTNESILSKINEKGWLKNNWTLQQKKWMPVRKTESEVDPKFRIKQMIFTNQEISDFFKKYSKDIHINCLLFYSKDDGKLCGIYPHVTIICDHKYIKNTYAGILDSVDPDKIFEQKTIIVHYGIFLKPFDKNKKYWYNLVNLQKMEHRISISIKKLSTYSLFLADYNMIAKVVFDNFLRELQTDKIHYPTRFSQNIITQNKNKLDYNKIHCFSNS